MLHKILNFKQKHAPTGSFKANVLTLMTGTAIAQAIPIAAAPILTRLYSPEDFGVFALYLSITSIIGTIATGRYELAIMLPEKDEDAVNLVALAIGIACCVSFLTLLGVWLFNAPITKMLGNPAVSQWLYFVPLSVLLTGIFQALNYWSNRKKQYKRLAVRQVTQSGVMITTQAGLGTVQAGSGGLVAGQILGQVIATTLLSWNVFREDRCCFLLIKKMKIFFNAIEHRNFLFFSTGTALFNTASLQLPVLLFATFFNVMTVGYFSLANRIINFPMSLIGGSISQVFFEKASRCRTNKVELAVITRSLYKKLLWLGVLPISFITFYGEVIFSFVFGSQWGIAGRYAQYLSLWILFVFISSPLSSLFNVLGKQKQGLLFNILMFVSRLLVIVGGAFFLIHPDRCVFWYGVVGVCFWVWHCFYILNLGGVRFFDALRLTLMIVGSVMAGQFIIYKIVMGFLNGTY